MNSNYPMIDEDAVESLVDREFMEVLVAAADESHSAGLAETHTAHLLLHGMIVGGLPDGVGPMLDLSELRNATITYKYERDIQSDAANWGNASRTFRLTVLSRGACITALDVARYEARARACPSDLVFSLLLAGGRNSSALAVLSTLGKDLADQMLTAIRHCSDSKNGFVESLADQAKTLSSAPLLIEGINPLGRTRFPDFESDR